MGIANLGEMSRCRSVEHESRATFLLTINGGIEQSEPPEAKRSDAETPGYSAPALSTNPCALSALGARHGSFSSGLMALQRTVREQW